MQKPLPIVVVVVVVVVLGVGWGVGGACGDVPPRALRDEGLL